MALLIFTWLCAPFLWFYRRLQCGTTQTRILIIQTAKIGDVICATPVIHAVRAHYPSAHIAILTNPAASAIIQHDTAIDQIVHTPPDGFRGLRKKWVFVQLLRQYRFNTIIGLNPALTLWLAPVWAGIPCHAAIVPPHLSRTLKGALPWLTHITIHRTEQSITETYRALLNTLNIPTDDFKKRLFPSPSAADNIKQLLGQPLRGKRIGLAVASANTLKSLSDNLLIDLTLRLCHEDHHVILIGSPTDQKRANKIMQAVSASELRNQPINAVGKTAMDELITLMHKLDIFIGVDSGPTHCAEAAGIPLVVLFGPTPPSEQYPDQLPVVCLSPVKLHCAPCSFVYHTVSRCQNHCNPNACMRQFSVQQIVNSVHQLLYNS